MDLGPQADRRTGRRHAARDRLHQRRHRIQQPGDQGRVGGRRATSSPWRPSTRRCSIPPSAWNDGLPADRPGAATRRPARPRRSARRDPAGYRPWSASCTPTTRSASSSRSAKSARICREQGVALPLRRRAGIRQSAARGRRTITSTCCPSARTRCTARKVSARCTCAGAIRACTGRRWTAAATSSACGPAR